MRVKKSICGLILIVMAVLSGCSNQSAAPVGFHEEDAVYRLAWQYILSNQSALSLKNAKLTRLELVERPDHELSVYALEYSFQQEGVSGWQPGDSVYLLIRNKDGNAELAAVKDIRTVMQRGMFLEEFGTDGSNEQKIDVCKPSDGSEFFSESEIEDAIKVAREYQEGKDHFVINLWYDDDVYQALIEEYAENTLYGMDAAAKRGDLVILKSDIYFHEDGEKNLRSNWKMILMRGGKEENWEVVDQGYG